MKFLGFECRPYFKTATSAGFKLYERFQPSEFPIPAGSLLVGKLDIHHPAEKHIKVYLRIFLIAEKEKQFDKAILEKEIKSLFRQIGITENTTYEADVYPFTSYRRIENRIDERGYVDGADA